MSMSGLIPLGRLPRIRGAATSPSDEAEIPPLPPRDDAARRRRSLEERGGRGEEEALFSSEQLRFARERMVYIYQSGVDFKCPQSNRPL